ncbi:TetR/AcrR family transcriptional regulator [Sphingobium fuliginis]|nr:TetR/AcrR family transcriptional regulator [Sphingobium fuliginis]
MTDDEQYANTVNQLSNIDNESSALTATGRSDAPGSPCQRRRLTREELAPEAREAILRATMQVVGEHGYANATIARVTKVAGIAQGTFYLYFDSRQALLDELLPYCGRDLLEFVRKRVSGSKDIFENEERGFRTFLAYMEVNPHFFRILTEAAGAAPDAHAKHFEFVTSRYVDTLRRALEAGELTNVEASELETVAYMLMAMREYLYLRHLKRGEGDQSSLEEAVRMYMKFVRGGLGR